MCDQDHQHDHRHEHGHGHEHDHGAFDHTAAHRPHVEPVVLEIGGELGALVVHTDAALLHLELEISPAGDDARRSHKDVLERVVGGRSLYAAVFDQLADGTYTLWHDGVTLERGVRVAGGSIAELDLTRVQRAA
jgi:ABC-type Zn2+ transport system substrate-binding protein/surface adhesin